MDGMNVHFVAPTPGEPDAMTMRVWERGAGITEACGTGATRRRPRRARLGPGRRPGHGAHARRRRPGRVGEPMILRGPSSSSPASWCRRERHRRAGARRSRLDLDTPSMRRLRRPRGRLGPIDAEDDESHRGAFGDFGGASGALIDRTFRERIIVVGVTLGGGDRRAHRVRPRRAGPAGRHRRGRRGRPHRAAPRSTRSRHLHRQGQGDGAQGRCRRRSTATPWCSTTTSARPSSATWRSCWAAPPSTAPR